MKLFKRSLFLCLILILAISINIYAVEGYTELDSTETEEETLEIDSTLIDENFNSSQYVLDLKELGISVSAEQTDDVITLKYDGEALILYSYDSTNDLLYTTYETNNEKCDILNAIFIDTISVMQGNNSGLLLPFALGDAFCYTTLNDDGIAKNYISYDDANLIEFQIRPSTVLPILSSSDPISENSFLLEYETLYEDDDCIVKSEDLIFYKTVLDDGTLELYIGQPDELTDERAYESILTVLDILFDDSRASEYFRQNYSSLSSGNSDFDGVSVDTNIDKLPVSNQDTVLVKNNMKYVKFTINRDTVSEKLDSVVISEETSSPTSNFSTVIKCIIVLIVIVAIIFIGNNIFKRLKNK